MQQANTFMNIGAESSIAPIIEMTDVGLTYKASGGYIEAIRDISFSVEPHSVVSVVGPSGCGKTTLLKLVSAVLKPTSGSVYIHDNAKNTKERAGGLSYMFQKPLLLPWRTVLQNVLLPLELTQRRNFSRKVAEHSAREVLNMVGLDAYLNVMPNELSGGMQQRVALARALVLSPNLLLMDEPFSALDEITRETLHGELLSIWERTNASILFITHNVAEAVLLSDRVLIMSASPGTIIRTVDVDLPRPRSIADRRRPAYGRTLEELRALLRDPEAVRGGAPTNPMRGV